MQYISLQVQQYSSLPKCSYNYDIIYKALLNNKLVYLNIGGILYAITGWELTKYGLLISKVDDNTSEILNSSESNYYNNNYILFINGSIKNNNVDIDFKSISV